MPHYMYVSVQGDDKIAVLTMDANTGKLTPKMEVPVAGGPNPMGISPDRRVLYVGCVGSSELSSFRMARPEYWRAYPERDSLAAGCS